MGQDSEPDPGFRNRFLNSLVDRIVTGFPREEAPGWFAVWGYEDALLNTAEPYHLWAIEADTELEQKLPLRAAGLNVHWVDDLRPFQLRKVRILNGAHTLMAPLELLNGLNEVRGGAEERDIIPSLSIDRPEARAYAASVFERFGNPFIDHRLLDIAMNSVSKFRVRLLPSLKDFTELYGGLPPAIVQALAGLIRCYKAHLAGDHNEGARLDGTPFVVRDDPAALAFLAEQWADLRDGSITLRRLADNVLSNSSLWGKDHTRIAGLAETVTIYFTKMEVNIIL